MRLTTVLSNVALAACLCVPNTAHAKAKKPATVPAFKNELGQTVYSITASHFDISPPLSELATRSAPDQAIAKEPEPEEAEHDSDVPVSRLTRSGAPDPVVQRVIGPLAAAPMGFNFAGIPKDTPPGTAPSMSDSNGSVGNDQFVETVNARYQVWSLNRVTQVATSILGPASLNTLWAGFGNGCETTTYPYGDPIVQYDKAANRWLISKFESTSPPGFCVAISTTANATGTYYRYFFALPAGMIFDYPKVGVMQDAYYVSAFNYPNGGLFVAMDRAKMLAGNAAATWQLIGDPNEGAHLPADLDGFAYPPNRAGGIFVSRHDSDMYIYRMKVNFTTPASTVVNRQAVVPLATVYLACEGNNCLPQPGSTVTLRSLSQFLMYRAAYRNYIDHESLVVSHAVNPFVSGIVSGARWYEFRLSGTPDATCPAYPCLYQQGTIADTPHGRSRWLPSIAMDGAENMLVGYSTTGKTDGIENHTQRYTGRAKGDPRGTMTVPETTIVTGTANLTAYDYWGDYSSMSVDPADDCTFWHVSQYFTESPNTWSTRIASAAFPAGSGAGQCPPTTCTTRPTTTPLINAATVPGNNQITVTWSSVTPTPGSYAIERAEGACGVGIFRPLTAVSGATLSYTDTTVQAGITYAYVVRSAADASGRCNAANELGCQSATATGICTLKPSFGGASGAASSQASTCGVTVSWTPAASRCPLTTSMRYNVYRGTVPDFVPSPANRIATCVPGPSSYLDTDNLQSGTTLYYVVRAEDSSTGNGGPCGGGNEESNSVVVSATPYAAGTQAAAGTWTDGGGDGSAFLQLNATPASVFPYEWRLVKTSDDPGANHTPGGAYAYRNAGPAAGDLYSSGICEEMRTPTLTAAGTTVNLNYWERHQLEYRRDGVAVEYSVNGGAWSDVPAPSNNAGDGCDAGDDTTGWETLGCTQDPPTNGCGYGETKDAWSGPLGSGSSCSDFTTSASVTPYAHRCHPIIGLTPGDMIAFRWRFASDADSDLAGFYLDDIAVTHVNVPNDCVSNTCVGQPNGTACSDGNACTVGDACGNGVCNSGTSTAPAETASLTVAADKVTFNWSAVASATHYDGVRGSLSSLPVGPGGGDEACFSNLPGPSLVDATIPAGGTGFWYLSRGDNDCPGSWGQRHNGTPRITTTCP